ncbi:MAG: DUF4159 domain-containing protein [Alphaproteobacteria bacterium]|jgi:hypothetical protein|nr:DUF4159 domain-containing protein [Alphaproteobacteria bacterium]
MSLAALSFATPWLLATLAALPVIWWLLRVNPPAPRQLAFPAVRLLLGLRETEETPSCTPLWLLLLRLLLAALVIIACAGPLLDASHEAESDGPQLLVVDDGWAAAPTWQTRLARAEALLAKAERQERAVMIATTAPGTANPTSGLITAADALERVLALVPKPWPVDRGSARWAVAEAAEDVGETMQVAWLSDGLASGHMAEDGKFVSALRDIGPLTVYVAAQVARAKVLLPPRDDREILSLRARRVAAGADEAVEVRALASDGRILARQRLIFDAEATAVEAILEVPTAVRNEIARLDIDGERSAGAVILLDERWRRRPVGLVSGGGSERNQPLLSELYYLDRALRPFSEVRLGSIPELLDSGLSVLVLADVARLVGQDQTRIEGWLDAGGVLVRFAGPHLSEGSDDLMPVALRLGGGRALGGTLTWEQPMPLDAFPEASPFVGLTVPDDVYVERQVLAEPGMDLVEKTWARLADGTPLVTAERRGNGWLVLFHTTANADWSSLALSGLFVDMLQRIVALASGVDDGSLAAYLTPLSSLDGFGRLGAPSVEATAIAGADFATTEVGPEHPPGEYGDGPRRRALNLAPATLALQPIESIAGMPPVLDLEARREVDLAPWLLLVAYILAMIDLAIALGLRGALLSLSRVGAASSLLALAVFAFLPPGSLAQETTLDDARIVELAEKMHFAYVVTGDEEVDTISRQGLSGLTMILRTRTAVKAGRPFGINPGRDELAFYPLIYWPVTDNQVSLSDDALANIDAYLRAGGMILFDTRDQSPIDVLGRRIGGQQSKLATILSDLNVPPLSLVPVDHVLRRSFYLLDEFPGRWRSGELWVERYEGDVNDGVSSIIIGGNDYAGAWALDEDGYPLYQLVPGGQRQRELALRFGVNLAMYALSGNYKADQVHIPAILRRLGRPAPEVTE